MASKTVERHCLNVLSYFTEYVCKVFPKASESPSLHHLTEKCQKRSSFVFVSVCVCQLCLFICMHIRTVYCLETKGVTQLTIVGVMTGSKLKAQCTRQRSVGAGID